MRLIRHNHNISTFRKALEGLLELLHRSKDDTIRFSAIQQFLQMCAALSVNRLLPQEVLTLCKLPIQLVIQIVTVCDDHNGRTIQRILQTMCIENHRQGFSAALRMPEHATLTIRFRRASGRCHCLIDRKILMVSCQNFELLCTLIRETNEVLYNIQQARLFKDALKEGIKLSILRILVAAVLRLPLHEAIFAGCDRAGL